jgi:hypothetical protein
MYGASRVQSPLLSVESLWRCFPWGRIEVAWASTISKSTYMFNTIDYVRPTPSIERTMLLQC